MNWTKDGAVKHEGKGRLLIGFMDAFKEDMTMAGTQR